MIAELLTAVHSMIADSALSIVAWRSSGEMTQELLDAWPDWIGKRRADGMETRYDGLRNMVVVCVHATHWRPAMGSDGNVNRYQWDPFV